ncbi:lipopolysaccharide biosynthesis protein [Lacinutrix gracilariae]|uniref:Lipopolysaccharide biosynthesis protein n=1 Tax=Lacinutrix gracilariae TaxID=1747198 RepID=A0ABW5K374_9FLAO
MKNSILKIYSKLGIHSARTKNISKHVFLSFFYKGGSILASFLLVPLTINFLDTENYGIWLTLSSFIAWFSFFDIGLGHGLRNKFAEARANNNLELAKGYVSTAYLTITIVAFVTFIIFIIVNYFVDWTKVFNTSNSLFNDLKLLMPIVFGFFCLQLIVKLITTIYLADQKHSMQGKIGFITAAFSLLVIWLLSMFSKSSLLLFGTVFSAIPIIILVILNLFSFTNTYKSVKPSLSFFKKKYLKDIFGLGFTFFIIQISGIILFSTDNFIIAKLFTPAEVVPYNIAYKYMSISQMVFAIILAPYWSSVTEAYIKKDFKWVKMAMKNLTKFALVFILLIIVMVLVAPISYKLWIGNSVSIPFTLTMAMALYFILTIIYKPFTYFVNGTGKIRLQMYSIALTALLNIPLSIFIVSNTEYGVTGVIIATIICIIPHTILCPLQYNKLINNRATGLWNK